MKEKGYEISGKGVSIKTAKRFDRQDYIDATQRFVRPCFLSRKPTYLICPLYRGMMKTMTAASFNRRADSYDGQSSPQLSPSPSMSHSRPTTMHRANSSNSAKSAARWWPFRNSSNMTLILLPHLVVWYHCPGLKMLVSSLRSISYHDLELLFKPVYMLVVGCRGTAVDVSPSANQRFCFLLFLIFLLWLFQKFVCSVIVYLLFLLLPLSTLLLFFCFNAELYF